MNVNLNLEVPDQVAELALRETKCGNAERAVELFLQRIVRDLVSPAPSKSTKPAKRKR